LGAARQTHRPKYRARRFVLVVDNGNVMRSARDAGGDTYLLKAAYTGRPWCGERICRAAPSGAAANVRPQRHGVSDGRRREPDYFFVGAGRNVLFINRISATSGNKRFAGGHDQLFAVPGRIASVS